ncbi:hypothetical protein L596_016884 [Steinernema carpocapsae]|uniref:Chloride channel CLIC-like protein 1 n=1 Tax=Steinernema carpocapsae TaxID=34508 RepID=A0A4U5NKW0_STECR|nr:hypothetical protein L596_016884 [Steinernema carpocapsae]
MEVAVQNLHRYVRTPTAIEAIFGLFLTLSMVFIYFHPTVFVAIIWILLLIGLFINVRSVLKHYCHSHSLCHFPGYAAFAVVSAVFGQVLKAYNALKIKQSVFYEFGQPIECSSDFLRFFLGSSRCLEYHQEFGKSLFWELNPFIIAIYFTRDLALHMGEAVALITGKTIATFIQQLGYIIVLPLFATIGVCCFTTLLLVYRYSGSLSLLNGYLHLSFAPSAETEKTEFKSEAVIKPSTKFQAAEVAAVSEYKMASEPQPQQKKVKVIKESYLKQKSPQL